MEIHGEFPVKGKYKELEPEFEKWWKILNSLGIAGFLLFLSCLGASEHKYYCAVISLIIYLWALIMATSKFPKLVNSLRKSNNPESKIVAELIVKEYVPIITKPHLFLPFWVGLMSLTILAFYPWISSSLGLYIP